MAPIKTWMAIALGLCAATSAQAQASDLSLTVGLKAWRADWSTFGYTTDAFGNLQLTQAEARDKTLFLPVLSARYRNMLVSVSGYRRTAMEFLDGSRADRQELDANVGYFVLPGVAATLGYKRFELKSSASLFALRGPVLGLSVTAPVGHDVSVYGSLGVSRMRTTSSSDVNFKARYNLTELGLAYTVPAAGPVKAFTVTLGLRSQSIKSQEALGAQAARDSADGLAMAGYLSF